MTTETMTVHKALCELKLLNKRITKTINDCKFCVANKANNKKIGGKTIKEYEESVKEEYQSIADLMKRYAAINAAVAQSNAETKIMDGKYTVAEAMAIKNKLIPLKNNLVSQMALVFTSEDYKVTSGNEALEREADRIITTPSSDKTDVKSIAEGMMSVREQYIEKQKLELIDPLGIQDEMKRVRDKIDDFLSDIDSELSISNATTQIVVNY